MKPASNRLPWSARRAPRTLHPIAWWIWAIGLATAVSRTTNPVLLLLAVGVSGTVVASRRGAAPWAKGFRYYLLLAAAVLTIRVVFRVVFGGGATAGSHVVLTLPAVPLPSFASGVRLGGSVTAESVVSALYDGLRLATLLCCLGAANSLADPKRVLRALPGALADLGTAVVISLSVAPELVAGAHRVRRARRLRGGEIGVRHLLRTVVIPVLEDALERSLRLAASMDSRGYAKATSATPLARRATSLLTLTGMCALCLGAYGLLEGSAPGALRFPALFLGLFLCGSGLVLGGRRLERTQYRPDPFSIPEWTVVVCGLLPAGALLAAAAMGLPALNPPTEPLAWPQVPLGPAVAIVIAALAGTAAPPVERSVARPQTLQRLEGLAST